MIISTRHTGIVVRDLEITANFYRVLGFIDDNQAVEEGEFIDQVTGLKNTKLEWIKLKAPDGYVLELLQYHSHPESTEITQQKSNKLGCSHMAFSVDNIDRICGRFTSIQLIDHTLSCQMRQQYCRSVYKSKQNQFVNAALVIFPRLSLTVIWLQTRVYT